MQSMPRHPDPFKDLAMTIRRSAKEQIDRIPLVVLGVCVDVGDNLTVRFDGINEDIRYTTGLFIVSDHIHLEIGERFIAMPIMLTELGTSLYAIFMKFSDDYPILNAGVVDRVSNVPVGMEIHVEADRSDRYMIWYSTTWSKIRGSVGGVMRALTHILHYHTFTGTVETSESGGHTHTVTLPNTNAATNPE